METIKKMKIDYIAPECNVISIKLDTLMQMIISSKEVGGQGAKRGSTWITMTIARKMIMKTFGMNNVIVSL
jgi:hypothetical protein